MVRKAWLIMGALLLAANAVAADFGNPGGPPRPTSTRLPASCDRTRTTSNCW